MSKVKTELVGTFEQDVESLIGRTVSQHGRRVGTIERIEDFDTSRYVYVEGHKMPLRFDQHKVIELLVEQPEPELTRNGPAENLTANQRRVGPIVLTRHAADRWTMVFLSGPSYTHRRTDEMMMYAVQNLGVDHEELMTAMQELMDSDAQDRPESPVEALLRGMEERGTMLCKAERGRLVTAFEEGRKLGHKEGYAIGLREGTNGVVLG